MVPNWSNRTLWTGDNLARFIHAGSDVGEADVA